MNTLTTRRQAAAGRLVRHRHQNLRHAEIFTGMGSGLNWYPDHKNTPRKVLMYALYNRRAGDRGGFALFAASNECIAANDGVSAKKNAPIMQLKHSDNKNQVDNADKIRR